MVSEPFGAAWTSLPMFMCVTWHRGFLTDFQMSVPDAWPGRPAHSPESLQWLCRGSRARLELRGPVAVSASVLLMITLRRNGASLRGWGCCPPSRVLTEGSEVQLWGGAVTVTRNGSVLQPLCRVTVAPRQVVVGADLCRASRELQKHGP